MFRRLLRSLIVPAGVTGFALAAGAGTADAQQTAAAPIAAAVSPPGTAPQACSRSTRLIRQLAVIDHTSDGGFQCIGVFVEGDTVKAIRLERHSFVAAPGRPETEQVTVVEYPTSTIDSRRGAVIDGIPGHDAILLRGRFPATSGRGDLEISYLYNGITNEYHTCQVGLDRTPASGWRLMNRLDQPISLIMVRLRQIPVIGTVGIANLEGACTPVAE
jgi:hypothetical protein